MTRLDDLTLGTALRGILPDSIVTVVSVTWYGSDAIDLTYKDVAGRPYTRLLYRDDEPTLEVVTLGRPWSFDGDGHRFRLVSEAHRIRLAHLFDPVLAVHTSLVEPLPHQITAVYATMLARQPLRFLLADDPGAGKTIMAGLLIKELIARGDLQRCLIVCPGSLAEQWQDELYRRFHLPFEILTNDGLETARTGNWFLEHHLVIARLDKLARDESVQQKLQVPDATWDLVVCDEAHKLSATFFGGEIKYTKRYRLGQMLGTLTRHLLLMTATPHNGKEEDFQLFMALLDRDRFEGRFRDGVHQADVSDLMRRMVKERLLKFDGKRLFPERIAYTVPYTLSDAEAQLYREVTAYVREEFNRAEALQNDKRAGTVGFALTILQRRLASSPEAIYQSLRRRRERLAKDLRGREMGLAPQRGDTGWGAKISDLTPDDIEELEDAPEAEAEVIQAEILDHATAARTIDELKLEIATLTRLEALALQVRQSGEDRKWRELASLLGEIFTPAAIVNALADARETYTPHAAITKPTPSPHQKLVIFTEHRDTLNYLVQRITTLLGRNAAVVMIHGGMGREERLKAQEAFRHDPQVQVLIATDAAGEGINLQRAHLMVNYDLPWNPNRLEQRFGRIHRIGQTEVCHLWNLVAAETREGDVYQVLLLKLEQARQALGGQVFDVLGKLQFGGKPLRDLLIEAIRYGERPEVRAHLNQVIEGAINQQQIRDLLEERALIQDTLDVAQVAQVRTEMERAEAKRLQPHYIESFFLSAFTQLGGTLRQREPRRYEITRVPPAIRNRQIGRVETVLPRYERVAFEKALLNPPGLPPAAFLCPGHPLLDATLDLLLERDRDLLRRGTVLVDERDEGMTPRVLFYLEHAIQDAQVLPNGERRTISKQMLYVELAQNQSPRSLHYAPYLDYRPLAGGAGNTEHGARSMEHEAGIAECESLPASRSALLAPEIILARPECAWITDTASSGQNLEQQALGHAIATVAPMHLKDVRVRHLALIAKTRAAVKDRLTKEMSYWDHRAEELKLQEQTGKVNARLNSQEARRRADDLQARLQKRMEQLDLESQIAALPPVVLGGAVVVPMGLLYAIMGNPVDVTPEHPSDTQASAARARAAVMEVERQLGYTPVDREFEQLGYDIESHNPHTGRLRFIEVKGRVSDAESITVTKNEILFSLNKPDDYILALVLFAPDGSHKVFYLLRPFVDRGVTTDFNGASINFPLADLVSQSNLMSD